MTKIIDGKNAVLGRLASYVAKQALKGEEIVIVNAEQVIITGNREFTKSNFERKRLRIGSGQKGPKISRNPDMIVKRAIRGMIPNHRQGRGKEAFSRIKCYVGIPKEFQDKNKIVSGKDKKSKFIHVGEMAK